MRWYKPLLLLSTSLTGCSYQVGNYTVEHEAVVAFANRVGPALEQTIARYDADKNGKISEEEARKAGKDLEKLLTEFNKIARIATPDK